MPINIPYGPNALLTTFAGYRGGRAQGKRQNAQMQLEQSMQNERILGGMAQQAMSQTMGHVFQTAQQQREYQNRVGLMNLSHQNAIGMLGAEGQAHYALGLSNLGYGSPDQSVANLQQDADQHYAGDIGAAITGARNKMTQRQYNAELAIHGYEEKPANNTAAVSEVQTQMNEATGNYQSAMAAGTLTPVDEQIHQKRMTELTQRKQQLLNQTQIQHIQPPPAVHQDFERGVSYPIPGPGSYHFPDGVDITMDEQGHMHETRKEPPSIASQIAANMLPNYNMADPVDAQRFMADLVKRTTWRDPESGVRFKLNKNNETDAVDIAVKVAEVKAEDAKVRSQTSYDQKTISEWNKQVHDTDMKRGAYIAKRQASLTDESPEQLKADAESQFPYPKFPERMRTSPPGSQPSAGTQINLNPNLKVGYIYVDGNGNKAKWTGTGWTTP